MSSTDDASSRLSHALEEILAKSAPTADWSVDDEPTAPTPEGSPTPDDASGEASDSTPVAAAHEATAAPESMPPGENGDTAALTDPANDAYVLPEIVPATIAPDPAPAAPPIAPTLPPSARTTPAVTPPPPAAAPRPSVSAPSPPAATKPATSWGDHMTAPNPTMSSGAALRAPGRRPRVRRVTRVLRHIDPWSTFKVGLLFSAVAYVVCLTAGVLLWRVADSTGTLDNVERWFTQFGWETFELKGGEIFHNAWIIGLFGVVALTGGLVLLATLFNLVSDIVGGVRLTVLEEEVVERTISSTRRYVVRRPPLGADAAGDAPAWDVDDEPGADQPDGAEADPSESKFLGPPPSTAQSGANAANWSVDDDDELDDADAR